MPFGPYADFDDCVAQNQDRDDPEAYCAEIQRQAEGEGSAVVLALPSADDAERLAVDGGTPPDELHVTLSYLGDPADLSITVDEAAAALARRLDGLAVCPCRVAGFAILNPNGADPERDADAEVLLVESHELVGLRQRTLQAVGDRSDFPSWLPHLTLAYGAGITREDAAARIGPISFDRVRVAYDDDYRDVPLQAEEETMTRVSASIPQRHRALQTDEPPDSDTAPPSGEGDEPADGDAPEGGETARWEGVIAVEGSPTGDGRMFESGALRWETLPLPLTWARERSEMHEGAVVVGRIDEVWRDGNEIRGRGSFDLGSEEGREAARLVREGLQTGISVDLDDVDVEIRMAAEVYEQMERELAQLLDDEAPDPEGEEPETDEEGRVTVAELNSDDEVHVVLDGRIRGATLVDLPAFEEARVGPADEQAAIDDAVAKYDAAAGAFQAEFPPACPPPFPGRTECIDRMRDAPGVDDPEAFCQAWFSECGELSTSSVVAGAAPTLPPAEWFTNPGLAEPTPLTVTDDGRIYGHVAAWGSCHTGFAECVTPPSSPSGYAYFHTGEVIADDGSRIAAGRITMDTLHAGRRLSASDTISHYENTGLAVADVRAGEDAHGIWLAGAVRPDVSDEQLRTLRGSPLSGDWRKVGGGLELVMALAVNNPGFPVPRPKAMVASGEVATLQLAGPTPEAEPAGRLSDDDEAVLARLAARERRAEQRRRASADRARRRVIVTRARARVAQLRSR